MSASSKFLSTCCCNLLLYPRQYFQCFPEPDKEFNSGQVEAIEKELRKVEHEIAHTTETLIKTSSKSAIDYINKKLETLDARKEDISMELVKMKVAQGVNVTEESVIAWLKNFCNGDLHDLDFRRKLIDVLINSVYLYDDKVVIYYNIKEGKQVCFIEMLEDTDIDTRETINESSDFKSNGSPRRNRLTNRDKRFLICFF